MRFPREMWAGSHLEAANQPRRVVVNNRDEYRDFVKTYNGKMNVYTSVYDYDNFTHNRGMEHTVNIDRLFLDIDAHGGESLDEAYSDLKKLHQWLLAQDIKHTMAFSGRGFYIFAYGKRTFDLRKVKAYFDICHDVVFKSPRLDHRVINTARLRRVQNTFHMGAQRFSIVLTTEDLSKPLEAILGMSKGPRNVKPVYYGEKLITWPEVKEMRVAEVEIESVDSPGVLPILPCLHTAVMTHNPLHESRHYLVQWYNEVISDMIIVERDLTCKPREISGDALRDITNIICAEIETIAGNEDVWIDYNATKTRKFTDYVVQKRHMAPSCNTLISKNYCVGKCWRYPKED